MEKIQVADQQFLNEKIIEFMEMYCRIFRKFLGRLNFINGTELNVENLN